MILIATMMRILRILMTMIRMILMILMAMMMRMPNPRWEACPPSPPTSTPHHPTPPRIPLQVKFQVKTWISNLNQSPSQDSQAKYQSPVSDGTRNHPSGGRDPSSYSRDPLTSSYSRDPPSSYSRDPPSSPYSAFFRPTPSPCSTYQVSKYHILDFYFIGTFYCYR